MRLELMQQWKIPRTQHTGGISCRVQGDDEVSEGGVTRAIPVNILAGSGNVVDYPVENKTILRSQLTDILPISQVIPYDPKILHGETVVTGIRVERE
jgi:hypothetical protein